MTKRNSGLKRHNSLLTTLEDRVRSLHLDAKKVVRNWEYDRGTGKIGEIDLLVCYPNYWIMYEVKCKGRYDKALEQYHRFQRSFPEQRIKGVYVSGSSVKRLS